jgi:hypothetical protein
VDRVARGTGMPRPCQVDAPGRPRRDSEVENLGGGAAQDGPARILGRTPGELPDAEADEGDRRRGGQGQPRPGRTDLDGCRRPPPFARARREARFLLRLLARSVRTRSSAPRRLSPRLREACPPDTALPGPVALRWGNRSSAPHHYSRDRSGCRVTPRSSERRRIAR